MHPTCLGVSRCGRCGKDLAPYNAPSWPRECYGLRGTPSSGDDFLKTLSTDVSEGMALVAPYLALLPEVAGQRAYLLREVFNALRSVMRNGIP